MLVVAGVLACTGDPAPIDTGLTPGRALSSLDDAEADQLCAGTARILGDAAARALAPADQCLLHGVAVAWWESFDDFALFHARCESAQAACAADPLPYLTGCRSDAPCKCDPLFRAELADCPLTVADWEACAGAVQLGLERRLDRCSCETPAPCVAVLTPRPCLDLVKKCILAPL